MHCNDNRCAFLLLHSGRRNLGIEEAGSMIVAMIAFSG
jgi:hypothetical protein